MPEEFSSSIVTRILLDLGFFLESTETFQDLVKDSLDLIQILRNSIQNLTFFYKDFDKN